MVYNSISLFLWIWPKSNFFLILFTQHRQTESLRDCFQVLLHGKQKHIETINGGADYFTGSIKWMAPSFVSRGNAVQREGRMSYAEFVWFLISEEDKKNPTRWSLGPWQCISCHCMCLKNSWYPSWMTFVSVCLLNICVDLSFLSAVLSTGFGVWMQMAMASCPCLSWSISMKNSARGWKGWALNLCPSRIYSARCLIWLNLKAQVSANVSLLLVLFPILIIFISFPSAADPQHLHLAIWISMCLCMCCIFQAR